MTKSFSKKNTGKYNETARPGLKLIYARLWKSKLIELLKMWTVISLSWYYINDYAKLMA